MRVFRHALFLLFALPAFCKVQSSWTLESDIWSAPQFRNTAFAIETADAYGYNWFALRVPLENGYAFENMPGMLTLTLRGQMDSMLFVQSVLPLRRDFEAWYADPKGSNLFYKTNEIDINLPKEGWLRWNNLLGYVQIGRFRPELGPSPNSVYWGNGAPYHDAILWNMNFGAVSFDWMGSSLYAGLTGTPDSLGGEGPTTAVETQEPCGNPNASETWIQAHCQSANQRNRLYNEPYKSLFLHRIRWNASWGWLALIEQALIGGKAPALRDFNPWMIWHDNFGDGYTKSSTSMEIGVTPNKLSTFYWQFDFEDIASPVGETLGETAPTTMGVLAGWKQHWIKDTVFSLWTRVDAVYTDPTFNNHRLPLLKMTSRKLYRSNYRPQAQKEADGTPSFADSYIVDYPLGYRRGADALDLWFNSGWEYKPVHIGGEIEVAWLRQGDKEQWSPWDLAAKMEHNLSGIVETEKRGWVSFWWQSNTRMNWNLGTGIRHLENENHIANMDRWDFGWSAGLNILLGGK